MKFLRLPDFLISVLYEDDDILAIDKPYGFNAHTNDSKIEHSEFIQDGLIEMFEKQLGKKLHIIHRLDQTTTGVMIFGKSPEGAKKYADFFFNRQVRKTYWFITASQSSKKSYEIADPIIHKGKELDASTSLKFLNKSENFELWQASPHTGRNHQIRIHSQAAGISILGDDKYGGKRYPFLCLHNHQIEFPNKIIIKSKAPLYFDNLHLLEDLILVKALFEADRRLRLFNAQPDQSFRLANIKSHSRELGFSIDQIGQNLVLNWPHDSWGAAEEEKFSFFAKTRKRPMIVKLPKTQLFLGEAEKVWIAKEGSLKFEMKAEFPLFLNQRLQRNWVLNNSKNKSVLNLFSTTCSFGVAAAMGKASEVVSIESNKNFLNHGKRNFEVNKLDPEKFKFLCRDSLTYLKQLATKQIKYDLIICEAPAFMRMEKGVFKIEKDLESLLKVCLETLSPKGIFLFSTAFDRFVVDDLRQLIIKTQKSLKIPGLEIDSILAGLDFELPDERAALKSFLIRLT